ncbi:MAG: GNAT family N-acetyltransferase [Gammaproteobacteria bacterium]|uniref:Acetyltransferase n=1 Tax=Marinomonas polaris DSM 16579 TaxID=1122206 RepID=A0A1M4YL03_9GAMM|nr:MULTISPECIES: GNAT family N-acetyltransferase [Marinomonas]MBU1296493.1 GNAT family N-acetyltransferase [Gammaproteobacteria bacterium]MBU1467146.1 GNAT family N-acetyltransferase [Gammaproteobacteria bacterium]MBU2024220.1 GNAT family N-acetyltransferase [Gammaproteobacteria bacterium]MBU2239943.1 GNAT family N-acetyltransferase [Gammaproteobacteria bacterium]MBU2319947.1 GNAT family N-acetyltransferase [Gammaproteobacteria bacterium]
MSQHALQSLLAPKSMVVLTGDDAHDPLMLALLTSLSHTKKSCPVSLVGVQPATEFSFPLFSTLGELTTSPDLAVLVGSYSSKESQPSMEDIIAACGAAGIGSLLMLSWTGDSQESLVEALRKHNVRLLGPNSFGICRPKQGVFAWLGLTQPLPGRLALMSQSGTVASALVDWATWQGIGFSQVVSMGSPVDVMPSQVLDYLSNDFDSQAILMYLQKIGRPTRFLSSLRATGRSKPVAVVTEHSVGADERVLDAALSRTGAVRGRRLNDLIAAASVMTNARRVKDGSLLIIGNGAGPGELAAQRAMELGIDLLTPEGELHNRLESTMAGRGGIGPVTTVWASCATDLFIDLAANALQSDDCGAVLLTLSPTALIDIDSLYDLIIKLHRTQKKLVMVCLLGGGNMTNMRTRINEAGIPTFRTPETAIEGFQFLVQFQRNQLLAKQSPDSHAFRFKIDVSEATKTLNRLFKQERRQELKQVEKTPHTDSLRDIFELFHIRLITRRQASNQLSAPIHLRVFQDKVFGPAIGLSLEGAQQHKQAEAVALPPLNTILAKDLIQRAFPGEESFELESLLRNLSSMVCELPEIESLEMADVRLHDSGSVYADVTANLRLCKNWRRYEHLAIHPYPRQWVSERVLKNDEIATVRPVLPRDSGILADFVRSMSHETRYFRFISNIEELTPRMLASMSHIDYDREMALLAVIQRDDQDLLIGTARYIDNFDDQSCEFAVVLGDEFQGLGLASYLMRRLMQVAADKGIRVMKGIVLAENKRMIEFCRHLGFSIQRDPDDFGQMVASIKLTPSLLEKCRDAS